MRGLFLSLVLIFVGCDGDWPRCPQTLHTDLPESTIGQLGTIPIGIVVMDSETCRVEEVIKFPIDQPCKGELKCGFNSDTRVCATDGDHQCHYCDPITYSQPLVRRIICPSGKNGTSTVGHDDSKFHREVLQ